MKPKIKSSFITLFYSTINLCTVVTILFYVHNNSVLDIRINSGVLMQITLSDLAF